METKTLGEKIRHYALHGYFLTMGLNAAVSACLYMFKPEGTAKYFGGTPTKTSSMWVRAVAGGDALIAYLFGEAFFSNSAEVKRDAIRKGFFYGLFHMSAFIIGDKNEKHPEQLSSGYIPSLCLGLGTVLVYDVFYPPKE
jgi:hypothetical protein